MTALAQYELPILIVAILVGVVVAFWAFRRRGPSADTVEAPRPAAAPPPRARKDGPEGNGLGDEYAAAAENVDGEILGVDAHPTIPVPAGPPDNLQMLKGVGPKLVAQLNANGVTLFDQLARLNENEV